MPIAYTVDSLESIPQALHEHYTEQNGKYVLAVEGIRAPHEFDSISAALNKERNDHKGTREKMKEFEALRNLPFSPTEIIEKLDRFEELEAAAAGKLDEAKLEQMVNSRLRTKTAPIERERDAFKNQITELTNKVQEYEVKERTRTIHDHVREAAQKGKVADTAVEDILLLAERIFEVNESGKVVSKDGVGVTPGIDPVVWLTEMQSKRPHWWPTSSGGGAAGGKGGGGMTNPWKKDTFNLTEQGRLYKENPTMAKQLAAAAGVTLS